MGNIVNTVKRFSNNNAGAVPSRRCSSSPSGTSGLNKCTCVDNDTSAMGKFDSATTGSIDGCEGFYKEVGNDAMRWATCINSRTGCFDDINFISLPTAHTEQSGSDEANKDRETQNEPIQTVATKFGVDVYSEKSCLIYSQATDHMLHSLEDESILTPRSLMTSNDFLNKVSPEGNCSRNPEIADEAENSPAIDTHKSRELHLHKVFPADSLFDCNVSKELVDGVPSFNCKSSPEASLEGLRLQRTQRKSLSDDIVPIEVIMPCATLDARGLESTPKASFKGRAKRKRITTKASNQMSVPEENIRSLVPKASLKERAKHKRTTTKASNQTLLPKENIGVLVPSDVICGEIEKEPTSPLVEQISRYKVLLGTPVSRMIKTPLSYVHQSPLTRSKAKALSISTPESMKRSRSGRLIVPRLDPGSQNIIYGPDGDIYGVKNLDVQSPQEINSEPPSKRRKRSRLLSPDHHRLIPF